MNQLTSSAACFRHVVFPDTQGGTRRVVDFTAPGPGRLVAVRDLSRPCRARQAVSATPIATAAPLGEPVLGFEERAFVESVLSAAGLDASIYRPKSLRRRLPACLRAVRAPSVRRARRALEDNASLRPAALSALLIGVTSFFRDPHVFSVLASQVVRELAHGEGAIRAWSAGCSNGMELYSLAIVLAEFGLLGRCRLLGTDCRGQALEEARAGRFPAADLRAVHRDWVEKYFVPSGEDELCVRDDLRAAADWRCENLLADHPAEDAGAPEGPFDLILCRNVAIYLQPRASAALWRRLYAALRPGGVLVTGSAECPPLAGLEAIAACVFRKDGPAA